MEFSKSITCVVPARLNSSRLPGKVLETIQGKSLLEWVYLAASRCHFFETILFAVDDPLVLEHVRFFGGEAIMTSKDHSNGTSRIIELLDRGFINSEIIVNWQGDEPFIKKSMIVDLLQSIDKPGEVWTLRKKITDFAKIQDENVVKVVCSKDERALYFSRSIIPYPRNIQKGVWYKHIGLYAYTKEALQKIKSLNSCSIEETESLEQLRFLYHGMQVKTHLTEHETLGIDTKEHLVKAQKLLSSLPG